MAGKRHRANCFSPLVVGFGRRRLHRLALSRHPHKRHPIDARSLVDAPSGIDTPTTAPSRSDSVNLFAPWPRGTTLCTPARLPLGVSRPFHSVADIWPWMSSSLLVGPCCQDCISNILASFTGSPSAILTYRLYSSIDLLLHNTFTHRRWFLNGRGEERCWFWIGTGEEGQWF